MARAERISIRLTGAELAVIDEHRNGLTRSGYLRKLLRVPDPSEAPAGPSHPEAVRLLREQALAGNVTATVAYERALRATPRSPETLAGDELEALIRGDG